MNVCNLGITAAISNDAQTPQTGLGAPTSLTITGRLTYFASAATSIDVYIQTSIDGGVTWWDIANFHFTTASAAKYQNCNAGKEVNASVALLQNALTADTSINGLLGDQVRAVVTSVGTYGSGTQLTVDVFPRY